MTGTEKQHNTVETAEVRYVYRPVESLLLVMITNKHSNIVEDLETLRLFAQVLSEYCPGELDDTSVCKNAFEITFAFDEVVALGHSENLSLRDIQTNIEMDSHEEKLAIMIRQSKEREAQEEMKRKAKSMSREKGAKAMGGIGGGGMGGYSAGTPDVTPGVSPFVPDAFSGFNAGGASPVPTFVKPVKKGAGMQLGAKKGDDSLLQAMAKEGDIAPDIPPGGLGPPGAPAAMAAAAVAGGGSTAPVQLAIEEKLSVTLLRDGGLQAMEIKGDLQLLVTDPNYAKVCVPLALGENAGFQFKTHPNIDKGRYGAEGVLGLKDASRAFPTNSSLGVLKWRFQTAEDSHAPLLITCWPTATGGDSFEVNLEYELNGAHELRDVRINVPLAGPPLSQSCEIGEAAYDQRSKHLVWHIPIIDSSAASSTMEFTASAPAGADSFFPIHVFFSSPRTLCQLDTNGVFSSESGAAVPFHKHSLLAVESYTIV